MICNNCHNEIPEGLIFCPNCGAKVNSGNNASEKEQALKKRLDESEEKNHMLEHNLKIASDQINSLSSKLSEETAKKKRVPGVFKVFTVCFFGAAAALCIVLFLYMDIKTSEDYFGELYSETYANWNDALDEIDELTAINEYLQFEVDFVDANIAFINADEEEMIYHAFYCDEFNGDYFYAFNVDLVESEGGTPCPKCHS
jgi:hypothetical protein